MTKQAWRLLQTPPASGAYNMAVDEAILLAVAAGEAPPTLRFYGWQPACLSLGYFQPVAEVDEAACASSGVDLVRRPTGGSAILHDDELTYSLVALESDPLLAGDILTSYHRISEVLARGLAGLGIHVTLAPVPTATENPQPDEALAARPAAARPAPCFMRPARHEILAGGKKLVGSAQVRQHGALLQHGAIPLAGDVAALTGFLALTESQRARTTQRLRAAATTLEEAAGRRVTSEDTAASLAAAFVEAWPIDLLPAPLSEAESLAAQRLLSDRYANSAWTRVR
jgi:lipoyl(octanoyl) transferase